MAHLLLGLMLVSPAVAHKLKVFATVEGHDVKGYAFFVGGGRPEGSSWMAKDAESRAIAEGTTDAEGRFAFPLPAAVTSDVTITVDTHDAHIASATLAADRLRILPADAAPPVVVGPGHAVQATPDDAEIAGLVNAAVQRQVEPLLERIEQMDSRLRFVDILSGMFLIVGLGGILLWARGTRR